MQFNKLMRELSNLLLALAFVLFAFALLEGRIGTFTLVTHDLSIHFVTPYNTSRYGQSWTLCAVPEAAA